MIYEGEKLLKSWIYLPQIGSENSTTETIISKTSERVLFIWSYKAKNVFHFCQARTIQTKKVTTGNLQ